MKNHDELKQQVTKQLSRIQQAEKDRPTLLAQTAYLGTLGLLFVVPVIVGAYLGRWLDGLVEGYSLRWTLSLIILGVGIGVVNAYLFIKE
ncbi:AtpZ/AtpI family protein [Nitrospira sp. NS4]|uniref:AtpZ/AtpI family protein n=1 Tax=Nitrospira sp. NS4 TaxID=3414498 RepID=UPI003C2E2525